MTRRIWDPLHNELVEIGSSIWVCEYYVTPDGCDPDGDWDFAAGLRTIACKTERDAKGVAKHLLAEGDMADGDLLFGIVRIQRRIFDIDADAHDGRAVIGEWVDDGKPIEVEA